MLSKVRTAQISPTINENQKPALSILLQVFHNFEQAKTQVEKYKIRKFFFISFQSKRKPQNAGKQFYVST